MRKSIIDRPLLKEVLFDVFFFSFLYELAIWLNFFRKVELYNVISKVDTYYPTINIFLFPYFFYFIYIFIGPYFIGYKSKELLHKYTTILIVSSTIGFFIFILFPTCVDRSIFKQEIWTIIYSFDRHGNACPSFHVLVTWCIWIYFKQLIISNKLKIAVHFLTYLIVFSTVLIRQHALIDILVAIAIVEFVYVFVKKYSLDSKLFNFVETKYFKYIKKMFFFILIIFFILAISFFL